MTSTTRNPISQEEAFARIRLLRSPNIGGVTYLQLLERCGNAANALAALPDLAQNGGRQRGYHPASEAAISAEIAAVKRSGARYIFHDSPDYPPLLRMADGAPPILIARGRASLARALPVAMVGARNSSASAVRMAEGWARELAAAGCAVVSGLARGIDAAAHRGALGGALSGASGPSGASGAGASGAGASGGTIAIIASGIDIAYPPQNAALHDQIAAEGLLLTEMPPGTQPVAHMFPARNRIIAGIACGTLVVEASLGSGSLITARLAGEAGREVMAVPGSPLDPRSRGCNALIRDGAVLVQGPEDVLELIRGFAALLEEDWNEPDADTDAEAPPRAPRAAPAAPRPTDETVPSDLASLLSMAPIGIDELVRQSGAGAGAVQLALVELELAGRLARHPGGRVSLTA